MERRRDGARENKQQEGVLGWRWLYRIFVASCRTLERESDWLYGAGVAVLPVVRRTAG